MLAVISRITHLESTTIVDGVIQQVEISPGHQIGSTALA
jgi:hypothetical protein